MRDLDLVLRTPGTRLLMDEMHARPFVERAFEERQSRHGGMLSGLFRGLGFGGRDRPAAERGDEAGERQEVLALPRLPWATGAEEGEGYVVLDGVAVIDVCGVLTDTGYYDWWDDRWFGGYDQIGAALRAARDDERVRGIFLRVDSPGGLIDGCFELADEIRESRGAAGGKPVEAYAKMACSAAYALACSADRIIAARTADVGSIGVLILHADIAGMLSEWGIKITAIQSGARKTIGADWKPLSTEDKDHLQAVVDDCARLFFGVVNQGRGLSVDEIRAMQGLWFLADHAEPERSGLALKLIDGVAKEAAAFAAFQASLSSSPSPGPGAPAGTGPNARADTEADMALKDQLAALKAKAKAGDKDAAAELKALRAQMDEEKNDEESAETDEETTDEEESAETDEESTDEEETAETDEEDPDKEPAAKATGTKAAFALLRSAAAKGRGDLANRLAEQVAAKKLTFGTARGMLLAAPKASRLGDAMAGRDRNPGTAASGEGLKDAEIASSWDRAIAKANAQAGVPARA